MNEKDRQVLVADGYQRREDEPEAPSDQLPVGVSDTTAFMQVISRAAADPRMDPERLKLLFSMRNDELARVARREFVGAMARFKKNPPRIVKDKHVFFGSKTGGASTDYWHATLGNVVGSCIDALAAQGISHKWPVRYEGELIFVSCVLTHEGGHEEVTNFPPIKPDISGNKNPIQAVQSAITYAQRHTFLAAVGLAVEGQDDDGRSAGVATGANLPVELISEREEADLRALIDEAGGDSKKLLAHWKIASLADIPKANYTACVDFVKEAARVRAERREQQGKRK